MNYIDSDPTKFIAIGVETCSNAFQGLLKGTLMQIWKSANIFVII